MKQSERLSHGSCSSLGELQTTMMEKRKQFTPVKVRTFTGYCTCSLPFSLVNSFCSMESPFWEARGKKRSVNEKNITPWDSKKSDWNLVCSIKCILAARVDKVTLHVHIRNLLPII